MERRERLPRPGRHVDPARALDQIEPAGLDHPPETGLVRIPPPRPPAPVEGCDREPREEEGEGKVDPVDHDHRPVADRAKPFQRSHRVAQVHEQAAEVDQVEPPSDLLVDAVHAQLEPPHRRAERLVGDLEPAAVRLPPADRLVHRGLAVHGPVPLLGIEDVDRDHLCRAASLHLEGPEAVEGADVEAALALERGRERDLGDDRAGVVPAGRDNARGELDRVVPLERRDLGGEPSGRLGHCHRAFLSITVPTALMPNLLIVGAAKAGTTSLHRYLDLHPEIFMSRMKELQLFSRDDWRDRLGWYREQFPSAVPVRGEASPVYSMHPWFPSVPERIHEVIPDARLIYLVRDPVERLVAQYVEFYALHLEDRPIEEALSDYDSPSNRFVMASRYALQLDRFREFFPDSQIIVLDQRELLTARSATMR